LTTEMLGHTRETKEWIMGHITHWKCGNLYSPQY